MLPFWSFSEGSDYHGFLREISLHFLQRVFLHVSVQARGTLGTLKASSPSIISFRGAVRAVTAALSHTPLTNMSTPGT